MMAVATLTSKGQLTLPKQVRDDLGLAPGAQVDFVKDAAGGYRMELLHQPVSRLAGRLRYTGPPKTLAEMDEGIAQAVAESMR
jgi:AbrB family looped-hinge helix DNA binding protein